MGSPALNEIGGGTAVNLESPGFLNLGADLGADISLVSMVLLGVLFTFGVVLAIRGKYQVHRYVQTIGVLVSTVLVFYLMVLRFLARQDGGDDPVSEFFNILLFSHIFLGSAAVLLGLFIALCANGLVPEFLPFQKYKASMRVSYALYMAAIFLGVWVYVAMPDRVMG